MNKLIAYCGLDCEQCEARIATVNQDESMKVKKTLPEKGNAMQTVVIPRVQGRSPGQVAQP